MIIDSTMYLVNQIEFKGNELTMTLIQGGFHGIILIIFLLNSTLFLFTQNRLYLYYALYVFFISLFFLHSFHLSEKYVFHNYLKLDTYLYFSTLFFQFIYCLFFIELLKNEHVSRFRKYIVYYTKFIFILGIITLITSIFDVLKAIAISDFYTILNVLMIVCSFFILLNKVSYTSKIILSGALITVIGALISLIIGFFITSFDYLFYYQVGVFVELILFTIAVNYTYNRERMGKLEALYVNSLLEIEKNEKEKENMALNYKLDQTNRELANKAILMKEKESLIESVIKQLSDLNLTKDKNGIRIIIKNLRRNQNTKSRAEFEFHFNEVYPNFYKTLTLKYPNLSPNDLKLCAFLKLNLSTKDIVAITGKSINTIDVARGRLRKKMNLSNSENLQSIIAKIC